MSITCPKCGSSRVHRSHRRTFGERLGLLLAAKMKRCHECNFRFVQLYGSTLLLSDLQRSVRKLAWGAVIIMALLVVLAIVVWFSKKQADFSPSETGGLGRVLDRAENVRRWVPHLHPGQNRNAVLSAMKANVTLTGHAFGGAFVDFLPAYSGVNRCLQPPMRPGQPASLPGSRSPARQTSTKSSG